MAIAACTTYQEIRTSVGRFADPTFVDGAVFEQAISFGTILGTAHAGTPLGTQEDADARSISYDIVMFRSEIPVGTWDDTSIYNAATWEPYQLWRMPGKAVGWSGHTWYDPGTMLYPKDDGTPGNLLNASIQLGYGLYMAILTTFKADGDIPDRSAGVTSNNGFRNLIQFPPPGLPSGAWGSGGGERYSTFFIANPLAPTMDAEEILQATAGGAVPLGQAGYEYEHYDGGGSPPGPWVVCVSDAQVVRFRVNRSQWSD